VRACARAYVSALSVPWFDADDVVAALSSGRQCPEILPSELMHLYGEAARASSASRSLATSTARLQHNEEKAATQVRTATGRVM